MQLLPHHQAVVDRFVPACQADARVIAAFLGGSYARGAADAYSDLDLYVITTDEGFENFVNQHREFLRRLGELVFLEGFGRPDIAFYIFDTGAEGELWMGRESRFNHIHRGPYQVLLDKRGLLAGVVFSGDQPEPAEQMEKLRHQIYCFWHDFSHFITAFGRGQLWWAAGQLEVLRGYCVNLARLRQNFSEAEVGDEPYFKIETALPVEALSALQATFCPLERGALLQAASVILHFYQEQAHYLTEAHGIDYPADLERIMLERLGKYSQ